MIGQLGPIISFNTAHFGVDTNMAADFKTAHPREYYRRFLEKDVRPDGRELGEFRATVLNIGCVTTAEGSSLVRLGNTTVMCGIKAELAAPKTDTPKQGYIVPNVELSPLCSPQFRPGPPGEQAQVLSQLMAEVVSSSDCIQLEDLCIVPQKLVWVLHCDMVCLNYDGNITDACVLALLAAFRNTQLPGVHVSEETEEVETDLRSTDPLQLRSLPVSTTFNCFDDHILFVDPTADEESLATGMITIVTAADKMCMLHKPGGSPLSESQIQQCINRAKARSQQVLKLIEDTLVSVDR
ncbi:exosome complex component RRP43-like [Haliotis cracherodii]|uniref:exosome complex component RRP43-like n=1 Tax=Haliotis cracherodii TaxID=6455 RepID=UPI0039E8DF99